MSSEIKDAWPMPVERQRQVLMNAHERLRDKYKNAPLWVFIREMTSHGAGYSHAICRANGWNPDQEASIPRI